MKIPRLGRVAVGTCLGTLCGWCLHALWAEIVARSRSKTRRNQDLQDRNKDTEGFNTDGISCVFGAIESTLACLEQSTQARTPLAVCGGIICTPQADSGELLILGMSGMLQTIFGHAKTVSDLLPEAFRPAHLMLTARMFARGSSPASAMHPLNVRVLTQTNTLEDATLRIVSLPAACASGRSRSFLVILTLMNERLLDIANRQEEIVVAHFGGSRKLAREYLRDPSGSLTHASALPHVMHFECLTILFLDIKNFTTFVVSNDSEYVAAKLHAFHSRIAAHLRAHRQNLWH